MLARYDPLDRKDDAILMNNTVSRSLGEVMILGDPVLDEPADLDTVSQFVVDRSPKVFQAHGDP